MQERHAFLLVIDPLPDRAVQINSTLRNAGISIRVLHGDTQSQVERLSVDHHPVLTVYTPAAATLLPLTAAAELCQRQGTFLAVEAAAADAPALQEASALAPAFLLGHDAQLTALVKQLVVLEQAHQSAVQQRQQEEELEERLGLLLNSTRDPVAYLHEGLHVAANAAYLELIGVETLEQLAGISLLDILQQDNTDLKALIRAFGRDEFPAEPQRFRFIPQQGEPVESTVQFASVRFEGENCVQLLVAEAQPRPHTAPPVETVPVVETAAVTAAPTTEPATVSGDGQLDPLTGMFRRGPFLAHLNQRLGSIPEQESAAVYFLELDDSTEQLRELSITEMDRFVQATANELLSCLEEQDDIARINDQAYAIFAHRRDKASLRRLAEKIRSGIEQLGPEQPGYPLPKTGSVGLLLLDRQQHHEADDCLEKARQACALARAEGNRVKRYKPALAAGISDDEESEWQARIRYALENEDFYTVQRSISSLEGEPEGLVENQYFMHEESGDLAAAIFMPAAERGQLASQIDRHILPGLLRAVADHDARQLLTVSGNSLQDFSFATWFQRTLQDLRIPGKRVVLQWPARAAQQQPRAARRVQEELAGSGIAFALTGLENDPKQLTLLERLELQYVTLSPTLTGELQDHPERLDHIRTVVSSASQQHIQTIASNIATSQDLALLWQSGVKLVSGDFLQEEPRVIGQ